MQGASNEDIGKMAYGLLRYSKNPIVAVIDSRATVCDMADYGRVERRCPIVADLKSAIDLGAEVLVLGIAPPGGRIPADWFAEIDEAVSAGLCVVNGLHDRLATRYPELRAGQWIWDLRQEPPGLGTGMGLAAKLTVPRLLMIGTDMAIGKMTAGLEIMRAGEALGRRVGFVATGQIGISITGRGIPLDAVRVDYASSAVEREVLDVAEGKDLVIIEGQGSLLHPGSTATLPLMRGAMPTDLVLCHRAGQRFLKRLPDVAIPPLKEFVALYQELATVCGTFPRPVMRGIALNCAHLSADEAARACAELEDETGWPVVDPVRGDAGRLLP
jgi:uncharacterized NAD-dependent epimerase/dehydratase family protein